MFDGIGSSEKEKDFDGLGSATGAPTPMVQMIDQYVVMVQFTRAFWRMFPLVAPFVPK